MEIEALAQLPDDVQELVKDSPVLQRAVEDGVDTLEGLIMAKRAAGRPKDLRILLELEALLELRRKNEERPGSDR